MRIQLIIIALLLQVTSVAQAEVYEKTLGNGLKVIVRKTTAHRAGTAGLVPRGEHGRTYRRHRVAHVLEHMMFKGTKEVPSGNSPRSLRRRRARERFYQL